MTLGLEHADGADGGGGDHYAGQGMGHAVVVDLLVRLFEVKFFCHHTRYEPGGNVASDEAQAAMLQGLYAAVVVDGPGVFEIVSGVLEVGFAGVEDVALGWFFGFGIGDVGEGAELVFLPHGIVEDESGGRTAHDGDRLDLVSGNAEAEVDGVEVVLNVVEGAAAGNGDVEELLDRGRGVGELVESGEVPLGRGFEFLRVRGGCERADGAEGSESGHARGGRGDEGTARDGIGGFHASPQCAGWQIWIRNLQTSMTDEAGIRHK